MATYVSVEDAVASVTGDGTALLPATVNLLDGGSFGRVGLDEAASRVDGQTASDLSSRVRAAVIAILVVAVVCYLLKQTILDKTIPAGPTVPIDGLTIFAVFFVAALGIERLLEPLSTALLPKAVKVAEADTALKKAGTEALTFAAEERDYRTAQRLLASPSTSDNPQPVPTPEPQPPKDAMKDAALKAEGVSVRELERMTAFWTLATCLGMVVAASMKLYLLHTVGITSGAPWQEMLATGLIIGAGTKPLHDLVGWMSTKAET